MDFGGAVNALVGMRNTGLLGPIGSASGSMNLSLRYLKTGLFEVFIIHSRYTLLEQTAEPLLSEAAQKGLAVISTFWGDVLAPLRGQPELGLARADRPRLGLL